jgi:hypothetical protein
MCVCMCNIHVCVMYMCVNVCIWRMSGSICCNFLRTFFSQWCAGLSAYCPLLGVPSMARAASTLLGSQRPSLVVWRSSVLHFHVPDSAYQACTPSSPSLAESESLLWKCVNEYWESGGQGGRVGPDASEASSCPRWPSAIFPPGYSALEQGRWVLS